MRAKKTDKNHAAVRDHLRDSGWFVWDAAAFGEGFPDLVCAHAGTGEVALVEVKHGKGELNNLQRVFRDKFPGPYFVVRSPEDALKQLSLIASLKGQIQVKAAQAKPYMRSVANVCAEGHRDSLEAKKLADYEWLKARWIRENPGASQKAYEDYIRWLCRRLKVKWSRAHPLLAAWPRTATNPGRF